MATRATRLASILSALLAASSIHLTGCADEPAYEDGAADVFTDGGDGKADGGFSEAEVTGVLALANDPAVDADELVGGAHLTRRVATNIIAKRAAHPFATLHELDLVPYVGPITLKALVAYARATGRIAAGAKIDVVFSPQPVATTHAARVATMIRAATTSIDIAMYSYNDAGIAAALADATARGVTVRFLFETAGEDKSIADLAARKASKSGRLESLGVDVRYVNKILHDKFIIIDGPRDDERRAATAKLATGSANWSFGGAQTYDENTLFVSGSPKLAASYQQEFNTLWEHSRDFVLATPIPYVISAIHVDPARFPADPNLEGLFTSPNFTPGGTDGATWKVDPSKTVMADRWVAAIGRAQHSIHLAEGHLRMRAVAEALIARKAALPGIDIQVYLDQQEYISASGQAAQLADVATCTAAATTDAARRACLTSDFLFARQVVDAGIPLRFKSFAYRWDTTYAVQMHNKYMIIDGRELYSGSYNLSMTSEQGTFENALHIQGAAWAPLVATYEASFAKLWETGRAQNLLGALRTSISTSATIPLVFESMALTYDELTSLRALIRANCAAADSTEFRDNAAAHRSCRR